jgi:NodT family efflux transporter outer membrane factor (OMF) lipoprotein
MKTSYRFILLTLFLISCASAPRKQEISEAVAIPDEWSVSEMQSGGIDTLWWAEFNDPKLGSIINEALSVNHNLDIAATNVLAAASQAKIAGTPLLPQANLSFNTARRKQNFLGFPIPGSEGKVLSRTNDSYGVSLDLNWEVDLWGRLRADQKSAVLNMEAAKADFIGARLSLSAQVCKAWFTSVEAKGQVELSEAAFENRTVSTEQVRTRYESGLRSSLDYRLSLSNLAMTESTVNLRKAQYENSVRQLEILLGRYPSAELDLSDDIPSINLDVPAGIPADLISRRPDLVAAELSYMAANNGVKSAKAALYPQINLTNSNGTSTNEVSKLLNGDYSVWSIAGNILQPVFNRGRLRAGVDMAKYSANIAFAQYTQSVLNAFAEVETALANGKYLTERLGALERATEQSIAARTLAEEQYASGLIDFITMLETQRSAYDNESQLLTIRRECVDARIDLYLALGGGFNIEQENITNNSREN